MGYPLSSWRSGWKTQVASFPQVSLPAGIRYEQHQVMSSGGMHALPFKLPLSTPARLYLWLSWCLLLFRKNIFLDSFKEGKKSVPGTHFCILAPSPHSYSRLPLPTKPVQY